LNIRELHLAIVREGEEKTKKKAFREDDEMVTLDHD
jgi:hypothetical protein